MICYTTDFKIDLTDIIIELCGISHYVAFLWQHWIQIYKVSENTLCCVHDSMFMGNSYRKNYVFYSILIVLS